MTINRFLINKGVKSNTETITILQMVKWVDEWQEQEQLRIGGVSKSLPIKDAEFIYSLLPDWVKNKAPEGLDPTMYGTLSKEGDDEIQERVRRILGNVC